MGKNLNKIIIPIILSIVLFNVANAGYWDTGLENAGKFELSSASLEAVIIGVLKWILRVFIALAFIFFIVSGLIFLFAGANKNLAENAKTATTYSIIAVVIALGAYVVIILVDFLLTGAGNV